MIPSAIVAWINRDMPQFGSLFHDDSIYFVNAKAWATGQGHRIISLPGRPWQTKYPPLYPLLLSAVWRIDPEFPGNLKIATLFQWLLLPPMLWMIRVLYRRYRFPSWWAWLMVAALAINPYVQLFSISLLSELPFTLLLLCALLLAPKSPAAAGVVAGLSCLVRTAGLPLLIAIPADYAIRREWRKAVTFAATMIPLLAGWALWSQAHRLNAPDPYLLYYLDYVGYQLYNVHASNALVVLWKNIDAVLTAMGTLILYFSESLWTKMVVQTIAVGMIVGIIRLARDREQVRAYAIYGGVLTLMLVAWHYPPNARFLFPLFGLLLAGFTYQLAATIHVIRMAYHDPKQKIAAIGAASLLFLLALPILRDNCIFIFKLAPAFQQGERLIARDNLPCAARVRQELPSTAKIMALNDAAMYLLTGLEAMRMTVPPVLWYEEQFEKMLSENTRMPRVAREHGMTHLYINRRSKGDLTEAQQKTFLNAIDAAPDVHPLFHCGQATLYEIYPR